MDGIDEGFWVEGGSLLVVRFLGDAGAGLGGVNEQGNISREQGSASVASRTVRTGKLCIQNLNLHN